MAVKLNYSQLFYFLGHHRLPSLWKRKSSKVKQAAAAVNRPRRKEKGLASVGRRRNPAQIPEGVFLSSPHTGISKESAFKRLHQLRVSVSLECYFFAKCSIILIKYKTLIFIFFSILLSGGFGIFKRKGVLMWHRLIFGSRSCSLTTLALQSSLLSSS